MEKFGIAIHGGAGTILRSSMTPEKEKEYKDALSSALNKGYNHLLNGGTAKDAVMLTVMVLEDSPLFNAGKGAVFGADGLHEMDASIMEGKNLEAGAISAVRNVRNPIDLANKVMELSEHVYLTGRGAEEFAVKHDCVFEDEEYFYNELRYNQWQEIKDTDSFQLDHSVKKDEKFGTVGAVALDKSGNIAAATSTGGMTNKKYGRVGDSSIIGAGVYANNKTCAVSCTGSGEYFIRNVTAYDLSALIEHTNMSIEEAANEVIHKRLMAINGDGGLIAINTNGDIVLPFNTAGMYRAMKKSTGESLIAIYK